VDEAGRGCLAGPVVAAAVIWPQHAPDEGIRDSKQLSSKRRVELLKHIQSTATGYGIGFCTAQEIDRLNILNAAMMAMSRALNGLRPVPNFCLVDGNRIPKEFSVPSRAVIRGDHRSRSVAAASIVAKVTRDLFMEELNAEYPHYGWIRNKGYPTREHILALARHGPSRFHRRTFRVRELDTS
jgi:ribonuclease HII